MLLCGLSLQPPICHSAVPYSDVSNANGKLTCQLQNFFVNQTLDGLALKPSKLANPNLSRAPSLSMKRLGIRLMPGADAPKWV
jgi:hypothetical protein